MGFIKVITSPWGFQEGAINNVWKQFVVLNHKYHHILNIERIINRAYQLKWALKVSTLNLYFLKNI